MMPYGPIDIALLRCEFVSDRCLVCKGIEAHFPECEMDEALAERGFPLHADRVATREKLHLASCETMPPPEPAPAKREGA